MPPTGAPTLPAQFRPKPHRRLQRERRFQRALSHRLERSPTLQRSLTAKSGRLSGRTAYANKNMEVGRGAVTPNLMGRLMQFVALQYSAAGDPKKAFEV